MIASNKLLLEAGQSFVDTHNDAVERVEPMMHYIDQSTKGRNFDGSTRSNILSVAPHEEIHGSYALLDKPLFYYDPQTNSIPVNANNKLVNASDCSVEMLITLGSGIAEERYPAVDILKETMISRIGATIFGGATVRMLIDDIDQSVGVICKDEQSPDIYMATSELYFNSVAENKILAFDVHDITQHSAQLAIPEWRITAKTIAKIATKALLIEKPSERDKFVLELSTFLWGVVFEESVLSQDSELFSYGCLNWLAPGDTPVDKINNIITLSYEEQRLAHRWHYLDAVKDLYRKQFQSEILFHEKLNWMEELGYDGNKSFTEMCRSSDPLPFASLSLYAADSLHLTTPESPEELMKNANSIIYKYLA